MVSAGYRKLEKTRCEPYCMTGFHFHDSSALVNADIVNLQLIDRPFLPGPKLN